MPMHADIELIDGPVAVVRVLPTGRSVANRDPYDGLAVFARDGKRWRGVGFCVRDFTNSSGAVFAVRRALRAAGMRPAPRGRNRPNRSDQ